MISLLEFLKQNIWFLCIAIAVLLVLAFVLLLIQWKRVSAQKKYPQMQDYTVDAKRCIEQAQKTLATGILSSLKSEFGDLAPSDSGLVQKYISDAFGLRAGGLYIAVDALSAFVYQAPYIFLQGSDNVGGEAVLPLKVSENGVPCFYLEGLSICYRRGDFRYSVKYNVRFLTEKSNCPIEEVLEFEVV